MKKLLLMLVVLMMVSVNVYAADGYVTWHDSQDNAFTVDYDGIIKTSEAKTFKSGAIVGDGKGTLAIKNLNAYDLMFTDKWTLELDGTSVVNTVEMSDKDSITIRGSGVLKVKSIGLSMMEMTNPKDANHKEVIDKYLKGNYSLGVSGDYIVITGLDAKPTTTTKTTTATTKKGETTTSTITSATSDEEINSSSTTTISTSVSTTTTKKSEEAKEKNNNTTLYMAIGGVCAVALIAVLILKLKK